MTEQVKRVAVLGASGYTGADFLRLGLPHPGLEFVALSAERQAGKSVAALWPHLQHIDLPDMAAIDDIDFASLELDAVVSCLPHATTHKVLGKVLSATDHPLIGGTGKPLKIVDLSADFRLRDTSVYADWYGGAHALPDLQPKAVYGLTEWYRGAIRDALLVACPGCYPTAALLALLPGLKTGVIKADDIQIDAKSGVTGAGRGLKEANLYAEVAEAMHPYALGGHRHTPEIEQEVAVASGQNASSTRVQFTPHLIPINRGEMVTIYAKLSNGYSVADLKEAMLSAYADEMFVHVLEGAKEPATRMVRGSNLAMLNVFESRIPGQAVIVCVIDNLVKGSSGQALQNLNLMLGFEEVTGLGQIALFP